MADHLGLKGLVDKHADLGTKPGRANAGAKPLTLERLAGRWHGTGARLLRQEGSTAGTFLRGFPLGPRAPARPGEPGAAGTSLGRRAGPSDDPPTIDLDSTICETYCLAKQGALHVCTANRGYDLLPAVAAGPLRCSWRASGRTRQLGAQRQPLLARDGQPGPPRGTTGPLTMRADSGFCAHSVAAMCRGPNVHFSTTNRQHRSVRALIEAVPAAGQMAVPNWIDGGADVVETVNTPFAADRDARPVRLMVRGCGRRQSWFSFLHHLRLPRLDH